MKKKGLIISTVVMVVVLIAALTTTTFAWFSSSSDVKIDDISMTVDAASNVLIGVGTGTTATGYRYGEVSYTHGGDKTGTYGTWSDGTQGLGSSLTLGYSLSVDKGVSTGTDDGGDITMDSTPAASGKGYFKASGNSFEDLDQEEEARINGTTSESTTSEDGATDVVWLKMGILPQKDIYGTYCKMTITLPDQTAQAFVGMITALRAEITVGAKSFKGDVFSSATYDIHYNSNNTTTTYTFYFIIQEKSSGDALPTGNSNVQEFEIKLFIDGNDSDCCIDATGTTATIGLQFDGITKSDEFASKFTDGKEITLS